MAFASTQMALKAHYEEAARTLFNKSLGALNPYELNNVIAKVVKEYVIPEKWSRARNLYSRKRITIYFSAEFLNGRVVLDLLNNAGLLKTTAKIFKREGIDIKCLETIEDPALGNGGLGRLAACFIESAATLGLPLFGVGLYYKYGLFKQKFDANGYQQAEPDIWDANMEPWFEPHYEDAQIISFADTQVRAVPYELTVLGYNGNEEQFKAPVFPLRVWKAEPIEGVTNPSAAAISDWLYPNDESEDGKILRLRQEYFFVSAEMQTLIKRHLAIHGTLDNFEEYYFFQMNDTHPVMGCLEFIRLFENHGYTFEQAFEKACKCFAYTNHTIMPEALEKWNRVMFKNLLPDIHQVINDINKRLIDELSAKDEFSKIKYENGQYVSEADWDKINPFEMFQDGNIHMSRIACYVGSKINGVAQVHTDIIMKNLLANWCELYPDKFINITNGVTPRRWVSLSNPDLADFLDKYAGDGWITDMSLLTNLEQYKNDHAVLSEFAAIKMQAKKNLADEIYQREGVRIDPNSIFDIQVKRIHEYKRQLMNALRILRIYQLIKQGRLPNFYKTTFIIGGKAAMSYKKAIQTIALIKDIQNLVNNDPDVKDKMQVVFLTNFNVSYAEKIYAAANFSEQISTAGTEASGTGNMKFMMNGCPTIGTWDGANIEIIKASGRKNNYEFGARVEQLRAIDKQYKHDQGRFVKPEMYEVARLLKDKTLIPNAYWELYSTITLEDQYFVMLDLEAYIDITLRANSDYAEEQRTGDLSRHTRKEFKNTTFSGRFSSDRTVKEYAEQIWHIEPICWDDLTE